MDNRVGGVGSVRIFCGQGGQLFCAGVFMLFSISNETVQRTASCERCKMINLSATATDYCKI